MTRLVILISGSGTNLQAFIDAVREGRLKAEIAGVVSNVEGVPGLERAAAAGIPTAVLSHRDFDSREAFDRALAGLVGSFNPDLVILAGFMRILTPVFIDAFEGRMMNIHPSLLPRYPGLNTHQRAIDAGDREAGATVHFVTGELDGGPAIIQARVPVLADDTPETLASRTLVQEHLIYPLAAQWFCEGRLSITGRDVTLDGELLPVTGFQYH